MRRFLRRIRWMIEDYRAIRRSGLTVRAFYAMCQRAARGDTSAGPKP